MSKRKDPRIEDVIDDRTAAIYREMTPAQRIALAFEANRTARLMLAAQIKRMNPSWDEQQVQAEVARRMANGST